MNAIKCMVELDKLNHSRRFMLNQLEFDNAEAQLDSKHEQAKAQLSRTAKTVAVTPRGGPSASPMSERSVHRGQCFEACEVSLELRQALERHADHWRPAHDGERIRIRLGDGEAVADQPVAAGEALLQVLQARRDLVAEGLVHV